MGAAVLDEPGQNLAEFVARSSQAGLGTSVTRHLSNHRVATVGSAVPLLPTRPALIPLPREKIRVTGLQAPTMTNKLHVPAR